MAKQSTQEPKQLLVLPYLARTNKKFFRVSNVLAVAGILCIFTGASLHDASRDGSKIVLLVGAFFIFFRLVVELVVPKKKVVGLLHITEREIVQVEKKKVVNRFRLAEIWGLEIRLTDYDGEEQWSDKWLRYPGNQQYGDGEGNCIFFFFKDEKFEFNFKISTEAQFKRVEYVLQEIDAFTERPANIKDDDPVEDHL